MNRAGPPGNGSGRQVGNELPTAAANPNETNKFDPSATVSAARYVSKDDEECPELTEESLTRLEQGIWELSLEIVRLRSRIEAYPGLALSNNRPRSKRRCLHGFLQ
jgi:hypothetical protein